jgi:parallel beta-helix repeat protein
MASANRKDGIAFYSDSTRNTLRENVFEGNGRYGIYVKSETNLIDVGNQVFDNAVGTYLNVDRPPEVSREANHIYDNREADVRSEQ